MTATLERRVTQLESAPPAPPAPPDCREWPGDDAPPEWWQAAPVAVRRYVFAVADDFAAHPGADRLLALLWEAGERGERVPLVLAQFTILWGAWCEAFAGTAGGRFDRFWGAGPDAVFRGYQDRSGQALVALWRASGTRQLRREALALLAAEG